MDYKNENGGQGNVFLEFNHAEQQMIKQEIPLRTKGVPRFFCCCFFFIGHGMSLRTRIDEDRLISLALNNYFSLGSWDLNEAITSFDFFGQEERIFGPFPRRLF